MHVAIRSAMAGGDLLLSIQEGVWKFGKGKNDG